MMNLKKIVLLFFSIYISFLIIEVCIFSLNKITNSKIENTKKKNFKNSKYSSYVIPLEQNSININLKKISNRYSFLPLGHSIPYSKVIYCDEGYGLIEYVSDRYGLNNDDSVWDHKQISNLVIGDSFVQGACVDRNKNLSSKIGNYFKKKTINLGSDSNSLIHYEILFNIFSKKISSERIIFFIYSNDIVHNYNHVRYVDSKYKNYFLNKKYFLNYNLKYSEFKNSTLDYYNEVQKFLRKYKKTKVVKKSFLYKAKDRIIKTVFLNETKKVVCSRVECKLKYFNNIKFYNKFFRSINDSANLINKKTKIYFFLIPNLKRKNYKSYEKNLLDFKKVFTENFKDNENILLIDLRDHLDFYKREMLPPMTNGHFSEYGYHLLGETVSQILKN